MIDFKKIKCFLLDLDGTVYISDRLIDGAKDAINRMRNLGRVIFLTNNSSKSQRDYFFKLNSLGLDVNENDLYTSGNSCADYLIREHKGKSVYLMGTESLRQEFLGRGICLTDNNPEIAVASFDTSLDYGKLLKFSRFLSKGAFFIATHPDLTCPSHEGDMPDCGSFLALLKASTNRTPDIICGKPYNIMAQNITKLVDCAPGEIVMFGDRLSTDMTFAINNGFKSALVLSGETKESNYEKSGLKIDLILNSIADF